MEKDNYLEYNAAGKIKRYYKFTHIQNLDDAYMMGYIACDGAYVKNAKGNKCYPYISVNSTQKYLITQFRDSYCPNNTIYNEGIKSSTKVKAINPTYCVRFPSKMNEIFKNHGCFEYKENRRIVGIPKKLMDGYIRGVIDADGFITISVRKDCRTPRLRWFITHQSKQFLLDLQNIITDFYGVNTSLNQHTSGNCWRLGGQHTEQNKVFLNKVFCIPLKVYNIDKFNIVNKYLQQYYVPQASDELLEPTGISSQAKDTSLEGSQTTGEV